MSDRLDVVVGGVRLVCAVDGAPDAPPMVLLHALGENAATWDEVGRTFSESSRVIAVDLRGHGDSDRPGDYSFELMRDDVVGVLDQLGIGRVTLVGHSMGGTVAYLIAQEHPDVVERLVLEDTPPPFPSESTVPVRPRPAEVLPFDWAVVPAIVGQLNDPDPSWWEKQTDITAPTLIIAGGPSSHIPQEKLEAVAAQMPRCTLITIPVGHHVHAARPVEFASAVLEFLVL